MSGYWKNWLPRTSETNNSISFCEHLCSFILASCEKKNSHIYLACLIDIVIFHAPLSAHCDIVLDFKASITFCPRPQTQHLTRRWIPRPPGSQDLYFLRDSQHKVIYIRLRPYPVSNRGHRPQQLTKRFDVHASKP